MLSVYLLYGGTPLSSFLAKGDFLYSADDFCKQHAGIQRWGTWVPDPPPPPPPEKTQKYRVY